MLHYQNCWHNSSLPLGTQRLRRPLATRNVPRTSADRCCASASTTALPKIGAAASKTVWPSGLRRWLQAPVRKGVGSNPTAVITYIYSESAKRCFPSRPLLRRLARTPAQFEHRKRTARPAQARDWARETVCAYAQQSCASLSTLCQNERNQICPHQELNLGCRGHNATS